MSTEAYRRQVAAADRGHTAAAESAFLWTTYRWMSIGLALTGLVAMLVGTSPSLVETFVMNRGVFYGLIVVELVMVLAFTSVAVRASTATAALMFLAYAAINGVTLSVIFLMYTASSIAQVFFVSAGAFAGLSFVGATTKRDLTAMGQFMIMGLIGLVIASLVNLFLRSEAITWITTYAGVLIFAGLTAYDTQKLKALYAQRGDAGNLPLRGALTLYLDFINLFLYLLRLLGRRR
jgi:uncharacterized protein